MIFSKIINWYLTRTWKKKYQIESTIQTVESIFNDANGFIISSQARFDNPSLELTYGEIQLESFLALLSMTNPKKDTAFYDLGCGIGKTVWAAALTFPFQKCIGVEQIFDLHKVNQSKQLQFQPQNILFYHQNILDTQWPENSILYLNIASFVPETWHKIEKKLIEEPAETIMTLAKPLSAKYFKIQKTFVMTTWGVVPAYLHHRRLRQ